MSAIAQLLFLLFTGLTCARYCGNGWIPGHFQTCYKFVTELKYTWNVALGLCKDMGGSLATLETEEEIVWMRGYRSYHKELRDFAWIGGYKKDGKWLWKGDVVDTPVAFADWVEGEPTNGGGEDCLDLFGQYPNAAAFAAKSWFRFNDANCDARIGFICEKNMIE